MDPADFTIVPLILTPLTTPHGAKRNSGYAEIQGTARNFATGWGIPDLMNDHLALENFLK